MSDASYKKFRLGKVIELSKYLIGITSFGLLIVFAPAQTPEIIGYVAAFILGGSEIKNKLGF